MDKSLCSATHYAVLVGNVEIRVPKDCDARRWVTYNVPEVFWEKVLKALERYDEWEGATNDGRDTR